MYRQMDLNAARMTGGFWGEKQRLIAQKTVGHMWEALNDRLEGAPKSGAVRNMRIAAGEEQGAFHGLVSQDSDLFKWMEAAAYAVRLSHDPETERALDEAARLVIAAQRSDGYLNSYYLINDPENGWNYLKESCQLYCAGHMIEACVAAFEATGRRDLLDAACRYADCIARSFGVEPGKKRGYDGHAEIELALMRLYRATQKREYLELARYFIEERGRSPRYFDIEKRQERIEGNLVYALQEEDYHHSQSHKPIREQQEATGHAVKAMYFYSGAADIALETGDGSLKAALIRLWKSVMRQMYVTGAIGSSEYGESFTLDYDLPGDLAYAETCASIGLFLLGWRMLMLDPKSEYADVMERALYNGVLPGLSAGGTEFFYTNPLEMDPARAGRRHDLSHLQLQRRAWFECPCCPPNIVRLIASLERFVCLSGDRELMVNLFACCRVDSDGFGIEMHTGYPNDGDVRIDVISAPEGEYTLALRRPDWCRDFQLSVNGESAAFEVERGYIRLSRRWAKGDTVRFSMAMEPVFVHPHPAIEQDAGRVSVQLGPVVYCAEGIDNQGSLHGLRIRTDRPVAREAGSVCGVDAVLLTAEALREIPRDGDIPYSYRAPSYLPEALRLIPYALWNNRGTGEMKVFFPEGWNQNGN